MKARNRTGATLGLGVLVGALLTSGLVPAIGAVGEDVPGVVFLARSDVAADALAAGPVAAQFGAALLTTRPSTLAPAAEAALKDLGPALVIVLGGEAAITPTVAAAAGEACDCTVRRVAGAAREDTAAAVAALLAEYGLGGPIVAGATRAGDAGITGSFEAGGRGSFGGRVTAGSLRVSGTIERGAASVYLPLDGSPVANGGALRAAVDALAGAPALVELGPGVAHLGATSLVLPDGMHLRGAGVGLTSITADPTPTSAAAGAIRVADATTGVRPRATLSHLSLSIDTASAGYAVTGRVPTSATLVLEHVDVRVVSDDPSTITMAFAIDEGETSPTDGTVEAAHVTVRVQGGGGTGWAIDGGTVRLDDAELLVFKGEFDPSIVARNVYVDRSYLVTNGGNGSPVTIQADNGVHLEQSHVVGAVVSEEFGIFMRHSSVSDYVEADRLQAEMSYIGGSLIIGSGACRGSFQGNNVPLTSSCATS